ncbi:MAG TPA: hypothetical protein VHU40_07905 [Polyangia bacterium]|nr:hypothetical protein [Polyangia bacterium]
MWAGVGSLVCLMAFGTAPATPMLTAAARSGAPSQEPASPPASGAAKNAPAAATPPQNASTSATGGLTGSLDVTHRRELDDIRRQDLATALARHDIMIDWHEHKLAELVDWRDRVEVASLIGVEYDLQLDWRTMSLADLNDIRLRAGKSAELNRTFGVTIDWRLYSWRQLEELRRAVAKIQASEGPNTADGKGRRARSAPAVAKPSSPVAPPSSTRPDRTAVTDI